MNEWLDILNNMSTYGHPVAINVVRALVLLSPRHQLDASPVVGQDVGEPVLGSVYWQLGDSLRLFTTNELEVLYHKHTCF